MTGVDSALLLLAALAGALLAAVAALLPALHITNLAALVLLAVAAGGWPVPSQALAFLFLGLAAGYGMLSTLPAVFLAVPDEAAVFVVPAGQKYLRQRRGYEAAALTGIGGMGGFVVLALLAIPAASVLPRLYAVLQPHMHWMLWAVTSWMLLSEWPKGAERAPAGWRRWWEGWKSLAAGLASFVLSGLLGFILLYRSPLPVTAAYQNLLPAFAGLFAVPWIVQNIVSRAEVEVQHVATSLDVTPDLLLRGTLAGALGGLFAALFPVVTGGVGALIAGHATAQRDDRLFLISQGACKAIYSAGGLLLFFVPGLHLTRGGLAWMLSTRWSAFTPQVYYLAVGAVVLAGSVAFFLLLLLARWASRLVVRVRYRWLSLGALLVLLAVIVAVTGWTGLLVCAVATGIGLVPVLWGSRRVNLMGLLLLPIGLDMIGVAEGVARWMGLM